MRTHVGRGEVCGWSGDGEWCECMRACVGGGGVCGCACGRRCLHVCVRFGVCVIGVCQLESEQARCGGRSCDGGRRAALDVADDIGVRVRLYGVMGCVGLVVCVMMVC